MDDLAPGVRGYTMVDGDTIYVPVILATEEGSGAVGRFVDSLPTDKTVVFSSTLSDRLAGMLTRRGFHYEARYFPEAEEYVDCFVRAGRGDPTP